MNRLLYILLISLITILGFTMYKQNDLGHVSFNFAGLTFETNLIVFSAALLSFLFVVLVLVKAYQYIKNALIYLANKRQKTLEEKARLSLSQGIIEYAEGRYEQSEKTLLQQIKYSENRLVVYLTAARAAQQLGAHDRRDDYLRKAHLEAPDAELAISLTKAELQLAHEQYELALATLTQLNSVTKNHTYVLTLLANTYKQLQDWDNLSDLLPQLKKHGSLSAENFLAFEILVCNGKLSNLAKTAMLEKSDEQLLMNFWNEIPHHLKELSEVVENYAKLLISINAVTEAEKVLRSHLNKNWEESTIVLYSELNVTVDNKQLEIVENWLKDHQHNAYLLLALGKMCTSLSLWGKAKSYLEISIAICPMPENYLKLARLLEEHMNDVTTAQEYYRHGLHLLAGEYSEKLVDKDTDDVEHETRQLKVVKT